MGIYINQIRKFLDPQAKDEEITYKVNYQNSGPGYLDKWFLFMEGKKDCWQQRESQRTQGAKKKIIFSHPLQNEFPPNKLELKLMSALSANYDVYLWPGEKVNFTECAPLNSSAEFWDKRGSCIPATEAAIKESLALQGISTEDFIILDYAAYNGLLKNLFQEYGKEEEKEPIEEESFFKKPKIKKEYAEDTLDLTLSERLSDDRFKTIEKAVDISAIKKVKLTNPDQKEIDTIQRFSNLEEVELHHTNDEWLKLNLAQFSVPNLKITAVDTCPTLALPTQYKKIAIANTAYEVKEIKLLPSDTNVLEELSIADAHLEKIDWQAAKNLERLSLNKIFMDEREANKLSFKGLQKLQELYIDSFYALKKLELDSLIHLKKLHLKSLEINKAPDLSANTLLEELIYDAPNRDVKIDLNHNTSLKKIEINTKGEVKLDGFSRLTELETLIIKSDYPGKINLHDHKHLKHLILKSSYNNKERCPDISHLTELEELVLELFEIPSNFNLQNFQKLKRLSLRPNNELGAIDLSQCKELEELCLLGAKSQGLMHCTKLKKLSIAGRDLSSIDFSQLPLLEELTIMGPIPGHFDWKNLGHLKHLTFPYDFDSNKIDFSQLHSLEELVIRECRDVSKIDLSACKKLKRLSLRMNSEIGTLDLSSLPALESVELLAFSKLKNLKMNNPHLKILKLEYLPKLNPDLTELPQLEQFHFHDEIGVRPGFYEEARESKNRRDLHIDASLTQLKDVSIITTNDINLNLKDATALKKLTVAGGNVNADLSNCTSLSQLSIETKEELELQHLEDCTKLRTAEIQIPKYAARSLTSLPTECAVFKKQSRDIPPSEFREAIFDLSKLSENQVQRLNNDSPVSYFSLDSILSDKIDGETGSPSSAHVASGEIMITLEAKDRIDRTSFCIGTLDKILLSGDKLSFISDQKDSDFNEKIQPFSAFDENDIALARSLVKKDATFVSGYFKGKLEFGKRYPLPTHHTVSDKDFDIRYKPKDAVKVLWNPKHQQYYVTLKKPTTEPVEVLYLYKHNPEYEKLLKGEPLKLKKLLPDRLEKIIKNVIDETPKLHFLKPAGLFKKEKSLEEKLKLLIEYCKFDNRELNSRPIFDLDILIDIIKERKGVCRHRAEAFMVLAHYIGIPARIRVNETHAFCEVPYFQKNKNLEWRKIDLGGANRLDLTPTHMRQNIFDKAKLNIPKTAAKLKSKKTTTTLEKKIEDNFFTEFSELVEKHELTSVSSLLEKKALPPVVELSGQDPFMVNKLIMQELDRRNENIHTKHVYIHRPEDFALYLKPYSLENGERIQIEGPLMDIIRSGGTIVVNWANFTATEIASFKSILDTEPTLLGESVSKKVNVIGLTKTGTESCSAFLSRCQRYTLSKDFLTNVSDAEVKPTSKKEVIEVDLFNRINWREDLLGKITYESDRVLLSDGPLIQAIQENKSITIYNTPKEDKDFATLIERIRRERKLLYNGKLLKIPTDVKIDMQTKPHVDKLPNVNILTEPKENDKRSPIFLGLHNLHECFETLQIETPKAHTLSQGFLENYKENEDIFYLTESIPKSDWQFLLAKIEKEYPNKKFDFMLAPGVAIEQIKENKQRAAMTPLTTTDSHPSVIFTTDTDYLCSQLADKHSSSEKVLIVDITPQTSFRDLIFETKIDQQKSDSKKVNFSIQQKGILNALSEGKTVILNGELSSGLYQQLLPLFSSTPHVFYNGERIDVKGQLISVQPKVAIEKIQPIQAGVFDFNFKHYADAFVQDKKYFEQVRAFYDYVEKLPHRGPGRPAAPSLSFALIESMINKLKQGQKLHSHNPIKGIFLYDYPIKSDDYAYLNVIAKYLFAPDDKSVVRDLKLRDLIHEFSIQTKADLKKHVWPILNCFRGKELNKILGPNLLAMLDSKASYPTLNNQTLDELWGAVTQVIKAPGAKAQLKSHVEKRTKQLQILLDNEKSFFILLKGPPGVGKTQTVRELKDKNDIAYYEGKKAIIDWLTDTSEKKKILLLDEANMAFPGTWDFLKGITRKHKTIYFEGKEYPLTKNHKIIAPVNFESFQDRYYHPLFQNYGEAIIFSMPEDNYLEKNILQPILQKANLSKFDFAQKLLTAYHLINEHNPTFGYSMRDMENLARRFVLLANGITDQNTLQETLLRACVGEFSGNIPNPEKRNIFIAELAEKLKIKNMMAANNLPPMIKISDTKAVPSEKIYLIEAIEQDLMLRQIAMKEPMKGEMPYYKQGVLLEGDAGIGKSTVLKALLERNDMRKDHPDPQKKYYEISAGSKKEVSKILKQAFQEGAVVILDELNLDKSLEKLLNQLLTGKDKHGNLPKNPGFMVFASQNPSHFAGRKSVAQSLRNRMHVLYMEPYSTKALRNIASAHGVPEPKLFVRAYKKAKTAYPTANMRTFYTALKKRQS